MSVPYTALNFRIEPLQPYTEILIAELAVLGFESFEETNKGVVAYIQNDANISSAVQKLDLLHKSEVQISFTQETIAPQNWNATWEKDFAAVVVDNRCRVRATFHEAADYPLEIIIDPKMSFGTGHHETTYLMLSHLLENDVRERTVLDMGCGTGVLGIAASLLGAASVLGVDIEPWCIENTLENARHNHCDNINVLQRDTVPSDQGTFDWVIANINRNVLLEQMQAYQQVLRENGRILLSGFYQKDVASISKQMTTLGLNNVATKQKNDWVAMLFRAES